MTTTFGQIKREFFKKFEIPVLKDMSFENKLIDRSPQTTLEIYIYPEEFDSFFKKLNMNQNLKPQDIAKAIIEQCKKLQ